MADNASFSIEGADEVLRALSRLQLVDQERTLRRAITPGLGVLRRAAKKGAAQHRRSGALERAITTKASYYRAAGTIVGVVGVDRRASAQYQGKRVRPAKYAHLVEDGVRGRPGSRFFERSIQSALPRAEASLVRRLRKLIDERAYRR